MANAKSLYRQEDVLLEGLEDVISHLSGKAPLDAEVVCIPVQNPKAIRERLALSQSSFSSHFGIPLATIKNWEQGRRAPDQPTNVLLFLINAMPDKIIKCLRGQEIKSN